jgi:uncharacterized phage infection (PIP) family protein YhgE
MRRKNDTPTRSEVTETVEKHKDDMSEKVEDLDTIATDTETVRETLESLDFGGTADGADEVENAIEQAEDVTVEIFDREDGNLEEIQSDTAEYEGELQERTDSSESDLDKVTDAAGKIETQETVGELENAKASVSSDIEFLKEQDETAKQAREENEQLQQDHRSRVQGGRRQAHAR